LEPSQSKWEGIQRLSLDPCLRDLQRAALKRRPHFTFAVILSMLFYEVTDMRRKLVALLVVFGALVLIAGCNGNRRPEALFSVDPLDGPSPLTVQFDSLSHDPDGEIVAHDWDFGDGTVGSGEEISHTFVSETDRQFDVRLTVTDDHGATDSYEGWVSVYGSGTDPTPGEVLFFDDFNDDFRSEWEVQSGWAIEEGFLIHRGVYAFSAYVAHGTAWTNYEVEADLDPRLETLGIVVRCQADFQSYVLVRANRSGLRYLAIVDGDTVENIYRTPGFFEGEQQIRVAADGSTIRVFINDHLRLTVTDVPLLSGMPGLYGNGTKGGESEGRFDNFRVTSLE
jgi:hypothetical protein